MTWLRHVQHVAAASPYIWVTERSRDPQKHSVLAEMSWFRLHVWLAEVWKQSNNCPLGGQQIGREYIQQEQELSWPVVTLCINVYMGVLFVSSICTICVFLFVYFYSVFLFVYKFVYFYGIISICVLFYLCIRPRDLVHGCNSYPWSRQYCLLVCFCSMFWVGSCFG